MSIAPQFTYDNHGNRIGVFLSMHDWKIVESKIDKDLLVPEWEKNLILQSLEEYRANADAGISWEVIKAEFDKEDGLA